MELALWLLLTTFIVEAVGWIGSDVLANLVYTPFAPAGKAQKQQKAEILKLRAELAATSSQDEFSKWARIRRKLDKAVQDLDASNSGSTAQRQQFASNFKRALWVLTTVIPFIISSYHRKSPVLYLPRGWFGPLGWWLSLPSAPAGAVAVTVWTMACRRTIQSVKAAVSELVPTPVERTAQQFAAEQAKAASVEKLKVGVTASGSEEKVRDEL
ncbi:hypothetical protein BMF94_0547 [Rhodotorula taiwanensis]|uniref:Uncharacterized protein n=1 Tax=Rhodotorula taiwanensis TaxID=741276 RepID=A0A2S5BHU9_9BASI|nr:hypothetical protein BMF94_0547 [Rhodotorula taiwanensis]